MIKSTGKIPVLFLYVVVPLIITDGWMREGKEYIRGLVLAGVGVGEYAAFCRQGLPLLII
ncbi:hypothetical protein CK934_29240 [Chitinophaga sp. MD30]|nr:hypothetical protein CK934_29240 [Chitinophaga sp. MD30]